jgi:hypothetical protein
VRERIPQLGVGQRRQVNRKLHPAHLLKLEAAVRAAKEAATTASTSWFVPVPYRLLRRPNPAFHRALAISPPQLGAPLGFRTFQVYPKDLPILIWQVGPAAEPPGNREGHAMDERAIDRMQSWISDTQAMGLYSTLLFVVIALWVYVPA